MICCPGWAWRSPTRWGCRSFLGGQLARLIWQGPFPGSRNFLPRLEMVHLLLLPAALAVLITVYVAIIMRQHHSQFPGRGRRERNVVGPPLCRGGRDAPSARRQAAGSGGSSSWLCARGFAARLIIE